MTLNIAVAATFSSDVFLAGFRRLLSELQWPAGVHAASYGSFDDWMSASTSPWHADTTAIRIALVSLEDLVYSHPEERAGGGDAPDSRALLQPLSDAEWESAADCLISKLQQQPAGRGAAAADASNRTQPPTRNATPTLVMLCPSCPAAYDDQHTSGVRRAQIDRLRRSIGGAGNIVTDDALLWMAAARHVHGSERKSVSAADGLLLDANSSSEHDQRWLRASSSLPLYYDADSHLALHTPYTTDFECFLAAAVARWVHGCSGRTQLRKVIVLDCDNTLWGGVVGEVSSPDALDLSHPYQHLQRFMLARQQQGMLLCLSSKNSREDVVSVFKTRQAHMPLQLDEHIVAIEANWGRKSEALQRLSTQLNLGLDAFIFVDDSPLECGEVAASCPGVCVVQMPPMAVDYPLFLESHWAFDTKASLESSYRDAHEAAVAAAASPVATSAAAGGGDGGAMAEGGDSHAGAAASAQQLPGHRQPQPSPAALTDEDRARTAMYKDNAARTVERSAHEDFASFLSSLGVRIRLDALNADSLPRAAQLTVRTNQMNAHKRPYSEQQMAAMMPPMMEQHHHQQQQQHSDGGGGSRPGSSPAASSRAAGAADDDDVAPPCKQAHQQQQQDNGNGSTSAGSGQKAAPAPQQPHYTNTAYDSTCAPALPTSTSDVYTVHVADRFGSYGIVGVMVVLGCGSDSVGDAENRGAGDAGDGAAGGKQHPNHHRGYRCLDVVSFLLSCRVLQRGVEHAMLRHLGSIAQERMSKTTGTAAGFASLTDSSAGEAVDSSVVMIRMRWVPSDRNEPMRQFLWSLPGIVHVPDADGSQDTNDIIAELKDSEELLASFVAAEVAKGNDDIINALQPRLAMPPRSAARPRQPCRFGAKCQRLGIDDHHMSMFTHDFMYTPKSSSSGSNGSGGGTENAGNAQYSAGLAEAVADGVLSGDAQAGKVYRARMIKERSRPDRAFLGGLPTQLTDKPPAGHLLIPLKTALAAQFDAGAVDAASEAAADALRGGGETSSTSSTDEAGEGAGAGVQRTTAALNMASRRACTVVSGGLLRFDSSVYSRIASHAVGGGDGTGQAITPMQAAGSLLRPAVTTDTAMSAGDAGAAADDLSKEARCMFRRKARKAVKQVLASVS